MDGMIRAEIGTTAATTLLPREFLYTGTLPTVGVATGNDNSRFYTRADAGQAPAPAAAQAIAPVDYRLSRDSTIQGSNYLGASRPPVYYPPEPPPARPSISDYKGPNDPGWPLNGRMRPDEGGPGDPVWLADRGISAGTSLWAATRYVPAIAEKMPPGKMPPTVDALKSVSREEWLMGGQSTMGKALGLTWVADTALDLTVFSNKTTSWKTIAVDSLLPFAARSMVRCMGLPGAIVASVGAHALEKWWFEGER